MLPKICCSARFFAGVGLTVFSSAASLLTVATQKPDRSFPYHTVAITLSAEVIKILIFVSYLFLTQNPKAIWRVIYSDHFHLASPFSALVQAMYTVNNILFFAILRVVPHPVATLWLQLKILSTAFFGTGFCDATRALFNGSVSFS